MTKISALAALTGANLDTADEYVVVDKSDTSMAATGTDKKMTATEQAKGLSTKSDLWSPTGLTGATAASRYVGATASGAPASGTFAVGDFVVDQTGIVWICTVAGSPGTWSDASSSGKELGYAEITSGITTTAVGAANRVDATGLIVTVTVGTRPVVIEFYASVQNNTVNDGVGFQIVEAAVGSANKTPILQQSQMLSAGIANAIETVFMSVRLAPSAGSHTYKIMFNATVGGTAQIIANANLPASGDMQPAYIRVVQA